MGLCVSLFSSSELVVGVNVPIVCRASLSVVYVGIFWTMLVVCSLMLVVCLLCMLEFLVVCILMLVVCLSGVCLLC